MLTILLSACWMTAFWDESNSAFDSKLFILFKFDSIFLLSCQQIHHTVTDAMTASFWQNIFQLPCRYYQICTASDKGVPPSLPISSSINRLPETAFHKPSSAATEGLTSPLIQLWLLYNLQMFTLVLRWLYFQTKFSNQINKVIFWTSPNTRTNIHSTTINWSFMSLNSIQLTEAHNSSHENLLKHFTKTQNWKNQKTEI